MTQDTDSIRWGLLRLRARNLAYTVIQLFGFALIFWSAFEVLGQALIDYYRRQGNEIPEIVVSVNSMAPNLDEVSALAVFGAGAAIVWLSTR